MNCDAMLPPVFTPVCASQSSEAAYSWYPRRSCRSDAQIPAEAVGYHRGNSGNEIGAGDPGPAVAGSVDSRRVSPAFAPTTSTGCIAGGDRAMQLVLEGIIPRPSETREGKEWLRLRRRYGAARVLRHAPAIARALSSLSARQR